MNGPAYTIRGLHFSHGQPLFDGLDLTIASKAFTAVVGPNGSGKSTLLDLMTGQRKPQSGSITLFGSSVSAMNPLEMAQRTALMPQFHNVSFPFSVRETVFMGRHPHIPRFMSPDWTDQALTDEAMQTMDVAQLAQRRITDLSGGERQRTMLARALAQDTPVLLLDEPTANQDIRHALRTLQALRTLVRREDKTVVAVLHDLNHAAAFADNIVFLHNGCVHSSGPLAQTLTTQAVREVFGVDCRVYRDEFSGSLAVSFKQKATS